MKYLFISSCAAMITLVLAGCSGGSDEVEGPPETAPPAAGLQVSAYTDTEIAGTYRDNVTTLEFNTKEVKPGVVSSRVGAAGRQITVTVDYEGGTASLDGASVAFTAEEVDALRALERELGTVVADRTTGSRVEQALGSLGSMVSEAAPGEVLPTITKTAERGWVNIGPGNHCRWLERSCGASRYKQTGLNSPSCKGRCGAGCNLARFGQFNAWTMDCAEHDYHLGPFGDAVDDYNFAHLYWTSGPNSEFCADNCSCETGPSC